MSGPQVFGNMFFKDTEMFERECTNREYDSFMACVEHLKDYFNRNSITFGKFLVKENSRSFSIQIRFEMVQDSEETVGLFNLDMKGCNVWEIKKIAYNKDKMNGCNPPPKQISYKSVTLTHGFLHLKSGFTIEQAIKRIDKELETDKDLVNIAKENLNLTTFVRPVATPPPTASPVKISHRCC